MIFNRAIKRRFGKFPPIEHLIFKNEGGIDTNIQMRIKIIDQKYIIIGLDMYTELRFIEIVKRHKSRNKELFNILKEYNPEYFI